jgi:hypothetical protein
MTSARIAVVPLALALAAMWSCKNDSTGPGNLGNITCGTADQAVCPPGNLSLGFNGTTGSPSITPVDSRTAITVNSSAYDVGGTTSSTSDGYWFVVVGGALKSWGVIPVISGTYAATVPLFCGQQGIIYRFDNGSARSYWSARVTLGNCSTPLFRAQLTWDTYTDDTLNSDMDLHLVRPGGSTNTANDCYYSNCQGGGLDWGASGTAGDPYLDVDNTIGFGPENITLASGPEAGTYRVIVRNYSGYAGTHATVKLFFNDVEQVRYTSAALDWPNNEYWTVATVNIQNQIITAVGTYSSTPPTAPGVRPVAVTRVK